MPCNNQIITKYMIVVETVMLNQLKITSAKNVCILQSNTSFCVSSCKDCIFVQSIYLFKKSASGNNATKNSTENVLILRF